MIKKILILLIIFNINITVLFASTKENIILNFKKIENITFKFKQTINEKTEEGHCVIEYPKKINCKYNNKKKKIMVSNGKTLIITDNIKYYYRYSLRSTPLNIILDKNQLIKQISNLNGKIIDKKYYNFALNSANDKINIFFDKNTYDLIGWQTEDIYQNLVITFIHSIEKNKKIDQKLFKLPKLLN